MVSIKDRLIVEYRNMSESVDTTSMTGKLKNAWETILSTTSKSSCWMAIVSLMLIESESFPHERLESDNWGFPRSIVGDSSLLQTDVDPRYLLWTLRGTNSNILNAKIVYTFDSLGDKHGFFVANTTDHGTIGNVAFHETDPDMAVRLADVGLEDLLGSAFGASDHIEG